MCTCKQANQKVRKAIFDVDNRRGSSTVLLLSRKETMLELFAGTEIFARTERQSGGISLPERVLSICVLFVPLNVVHRRRVYSNISRASTYAIR